ncbi:TPA: hypothetical protein N0F65_002771 [Lagenidium giganteum]|uniref:Uncharacterized protein n=1 Tax=Lagenidium giganteum TaxID=4803 RepID=A0AAV2YMD7_9STRA|nr:TPA: hypothetical protein N0F65_002771 [Lagenidium giganteum]
METSVEGHGAQVEERQEKDEAHREGDACSKVDAASRAHGRDAVGSKFAEEDERATDGGCEESNVCALVYGADDSCTSRLMKLKNPPKTAAGLLALPTMSARAFAKALKNGELEQTR